VVHVGDSLEHDIAGANNADIESVFIGAGIHAEDLGLMVARGGIVTGELTAEKVEEVFLNEGQRATWTTKTFCW